MRSPARDGPQSVGRILGMLETLATTPQGASLSELAVRTGAPKTSLVGLLAGLTAQTCVKRNAQGRYFLGPRFMALATRVVSGPELSVLARPILESLVDASGETAVLGAMAADADVAIYLDRVESANPIRYAVRVGERRELYCTAIGKALLAHFDPAHLRRYLDITPRAQFTANTITRKRALMTALAQIRREGIARSRDERVMGASAIAAPIVARDGEVIAAVLIAGPSERMHAHAKRNEQLLRHAAAECTRLVGAGSGSGASITRTEP